MKKLTITILMDNERSWYVPYADALALELSERGHTVLRVRAAEEIQPGDCTFFLSVETVIPSKILSRNTHNIVIHASPVPMGKGWSPLTWQILEGKNEVTVSLLEAASKVDSGVVYDQEVVRFDGTELIDELREKEAVAIQRLALRFIDEFPPHSGREQSGEESFYRRRTPQDSELDTSKTLAECFDQLRVSDNERYPAFFAHKGRTYIVKIYKKEQ